jgi:outer membrane protein OmpA-like peptidoglycan-associated protein
MKREAETNKIPTFVPSMMKGFTATLLFSVFLIPSIAQKPSAKPVQKKMPVEADCKNAIKLSSTRKGSYGPTVAPKGFGKVMDIKACDAQDIFTFEKERNSAWYYFVVPDDGDVIIEISSINPKNDYDFMLFKWTDSCFCDNVKAGYLLPARTNLSHSESKQGVPVTGLAADAEEEQVPVGVGNEFSRSLTVRKGEKYYLALDNVHNNGEGHSIKLYYLKEITMGGTVTDEKKKPIAATVWLEDANEKIISAVRCNADGQYLFSAKIKDDEYYTLLYSSDSTFTECRQISLANFVKTNYAIKEYKTTLLKLNRGQKYILSGISFNRSTGHLLSSSYPALNTLARVMMNSPELKIQIEGHVNNPQVAANTGPDKKLGEDMANEVYNYLIIKGVASSRMVPVSYGSLYMIYEKPSTQLEVEANTRIEIFFLPEVK